MCGWKHGQALRASRALVVGSHSCGAFLPGCLWPVILLCLVLSPYLVYLRILSCVCTHLSAKMDSSKETYRWLTSLPLDLQGAFLCTHSREGLLDRENEKYTASVFYLCRAQFLSHSCCLGGSVHRGQTLAAQPSAHPSPASPPTFWYIFPEVFYAYINKWDYMYLPPFIIYQW